MKKYVRFSNQIISFLLLSLLLIVLIVEKPVYAAGEKLPSGIGYDEIEEEVGRYFKEHEETSAGLAYSVFNESGDIGTGYLGYADKENGIAIDDDTVFEWGSGSKMLTWISVMQLYEQGKIDLEVDIRDYLPEGFLSNQKYDKPITMIDLMNHQAGFQDTPVDMSIVEDGYLTTLEEAVSAHKPDQIYEPGTTSAYSNWGTSLAAYIVSRITGMEFTDYVHKYIFDPLGMEHCALSSNLHDNDWVKEHRKKLQCYDNTGKLMVDSFYYCTLYPSGGCESTFKEYKQFAKALLERSDKLLSSETWDVLYSPTDYFANTQMAKNCHGLWCVYFSVPTVGHIGKTSGCSSYILIDPENRIGAAIICNQGNETVFSEDMMSLFFGDYKKSEFYQSDQVPSGAFYNSKRVEIGPFKFTGIMGKLSKDMSKEYWVMSDENSSLMEIAYMDYLKNPASRSFLELFILALFGAGLVYAILMIIIRFVRGLIRAASKKERHRYPLRIWSIFTSLLPLFVIVLFLMMVSSMARPAYTFTWISMAIGLIGIVGIIMGAYGIIINSAADIPKGSKIYNWTIISIIIIMIINICYWNLFMFWKI